MEEFIACLVIVFIIWAYFNRNNPKYKDNSPKWEDIDKK